MERLTDLDDVLDRVWTQFDAAADDPGHPFRLLTFGTAQDNAPQLRTVVLRETDLDARRLAFHSDRRAQKIADIRANNRVSWVGWTPETSEQVRLHGTATVHTDDEVADAMWAAEDPASLGLYVRSEPPGTPLDRPGDGRRAVATNEDITRADVADGREHFAVVRTVIDEVDWLHLHREGHYRARFQRDREEQAFKGTWIVP